MATISVSSEVDPLASVIVHTPQRELDGVAPNHLGALLFEDIPWLEKMVEEHQVFVQTLEDSHVRVIQFASLLKESIKEEESIHALIEHLIQSTGIYHPSEYNFIYDYLKELSSHQLADVAIQGLRRDEVKTPSQHLGLSSLQQKGESYYITPLPNLYFTRDMGTVIGDALFTATMHAPIRQRESYLLRHIGTYHPSFSNTLKIKSVPSFLSLEGGDILHLSEDTLCIGSSLRSSHGAIEYFAQQILTQDMGIKEILVAEIPKERRCMHLDTLMTLVDRDKILIYPNMHTDIQYFSIKRKGKELQYKESSFPKFLEPITFPKETTEISREQWNDGFNTLAVAPGKVIAYNRNVRCNDLLRNHNIEVQEIESSELVKGRGGPHCMSLPVERA